MRTFAVIGGASAYAPGLIAALIHHAGDLALAEVRLCDIDERRLDIVSRLCRRMAEAAQVPFMVTATTSLLEAVRGADAVLNSARPGGFACRRIDETLPVEHGMPGQETVGPGGFFFALRSVPEAIRLAELMAAHAPGAVLINYTNPTNVVTQALTDLGAVPVIGICDQSDDDLETLAASVGRAGQPYAFRCVGLNHATWYSEVAIGGAPLSGLGPRPNPPGLDLEHQLRFRASRRLAAGRADEWPNSYLPYYESPELFVALGRRRGPRTDAILAGLDGYYRHFAEEAERPVPELRHHRGTAGFGDLAVLTLGALTAEIPKRLVLNLENRGASADMAGDTVIETHVELGRAGAARALAPPVRAGDAPLLRRLEEYQRLTATAARSGRGDELVAALAANPLCSGPGAARALLEAAKARYRERVPVFA